MTRILRGFRAVSMTGLGVCALAVAGCSGSGGSSVRSPGAVAPAPASLVGSWVLDRFDGQPTPVPLNLDLTSDGRTSGKFDCNRFFGGYSFAQGQIHFGAQGMTQMACPPGGGSGGAQTMAMDLFDKGGAVSLSSDGRRLEIAGRYVFVRGDGAQQ